MKTTDVVNPDLSIESCARRLKLMAPDRRFEVARSMNLEQCLTEVQEWLETQT
jgi:hypothetical protein